MSKTYTTTELGELLGIQRQTIRKAIYKGKLKAEKVGRDYFITEEAIKAWSVIRHPRKRKKKEGTGGND